MIAHGTPNHYPPASTSPQQFPSAQSSAIGRWEFLKPRVRLIGSAVIAALALLTLVAFAPDINADSSAERAATWIEDSANQENTAGAPQQQVVNGWTGNALLDLISEQLDEQTSPDQRPVALLTLGILLLALIAATTPAPKRPAQYGTWNPTGQARQ